MSLIFVASSDPESGPRGSRLLVPLLRWLVPDLSPAAFEGITLAVRKLIHFLTFGTLAALLWRALHSPTPTPRTRHPFRTSLLVTIAYAASDEFHQSFVPTRVGTLSDVLIDAFGAVVALALIRFSPRLRSRR